MADANGLLATLLATFIGSGAGTTLVGILFKHRFDVQLERQKAFPIWAFYAHSAKPHKHWRLRISLIWRVGT